METLDNTEWDVLIVGTGLQQSLLALALSRSGKKILHIDENDYYGGAEAAFSLQEAESWVEKVNTGPLTAACSEAAIYRPEPQESESDPPTPLLSFSRSYSLALGPQLIYARSSILQHLVSSKVYRQLEFLAVGSWWVYAPNEEAQDVSEGAGQPPRPGTLLKVPNGREDVFQDHDLDFKAKRALMKFLRFIAEYEEQTEVWEQHRGQPFPAFLSEQFKIPISLHAPLLALTLSNGAPGQTSTEYALPRIARHLRSIGVFGAGFGAVIPKWGGLSEISQVACRASAVGGGVYVLGKGLGDIPAVEDAEGLSRIKLRLKDGEAVSTHWMVGEGSRDKTKEPFCKSVSIVSSPLTPLFPPIAEEAPAPASAMVIFPSGSLSSQAGVEEGPDVPPVFIHVHSSDTGECPAGQSILYASTFLGGDAGFQLLQLATSALLSSIDAAPLPRILWSVRYEQRSDTANGPTTVAHDNHILNFPPVPFDLAFDDSILDRVKEVWQTIMGDETGEFLVFEDRESYDDDE